MRHKHIDMTGICAYFSHSAQFTQHAHEYQNPATEPGFLWANVCASICCRHYLDITKAIGKSGIQSTNRA